MCSRRCLSVPGMLVLAVCERDARMFDISRLQFPELAECGTACTDDRALTLFPIESLPPFPPTLSSPISLRLYLSLRLTSRPIGYIIATKASPTRILVSCAAQQVAINPSRQTDAVTNDINLIRGVMYVHIMYKSLFKGWFLYARIFQTFASNLIKKPQKRNAWELNRVERRKLAETNKNARDQTAETSNDLIGEDSKVHLSHNMGNFYLSPRINFPNYI